MTSTYNQHKIINDVSCFGSMLFSKSVILLHVKRTAVQNSHMSRAKIVTCDWRQGQLLNWEVTGTIIQKGMMTTMAFLFLKPA